MFRCSNKVFDLALSWNFSTGILPGASKLSFNSTTNITRPYTRIVITEVLMNVYLLKYSHWRDFFVIFTPQYIESYSWFHMTVQPCTCSYSHGVLSRHPNCQCCKARKFFLWILFYEVMLSKTLVRGKVRSDDVRYRDIIFRHFFKVTL